VFARPAASPAQDVIHQVAYENSVAGEPMYVGGSPVAAPAQVAPSTAAPQTGGLLPDEVFAPPAGGYAGPPMGPPAGPMAGPIAGPGGWMAESPVNPQIPFTGHDVVVPDPWEHTNEIHVFDIRAGASIPVAGGVYADRLDVGWTIEASGRVLLDWPGEQVVPFVELGGGFIGNQAQRGATSPIGGTLTTSLNGATIAQANVNSLVDAELKSMQRGYVHLALGSRIAVPWQDVREAFNLTARAGMRVGHVHARFDETLTPAVQNLISQGRLVNPNLAFDAQSALEKTDIFWGVLAGVGASTPYRSIWLHGVWVGDVTCGLECDYVHDFFDLGQFDNGSHGLGSVNLLTTWTIRR
jgi:hypothetical protein